MRKILTNEEAVERIEEEEEDASSLRSGLRIETEWIIGSFRAPFIGFVTAKTLDDANTRGEAVLNSFPLQSTFTRKPNGQLIPAHPILNSKLL